MDVENPPPPPPLPPPHPHPHPSNPLVLVLPPPSPSHNPGPLLPHSRSHQLYRNLLNHELQLRKEKCKALYHAAINGDWKTAEGILLDRPNYARDSITTRKDTVLHVAALGGNTLFVRKLVEMLMSSEDLEVQNDYGCTPFYNAVVSGVVENAKCMIEKNDSLPRIRSYGEITPIHQAALQRHKDMVSYLHTVTPLEYLERHERIELLKITIYNHMHDVALKILTEDRTLALAKVNGNRSFLHMLVRKQRIAPTGGDKQEAGIWQRFLGSTSALLFSTRFLHNGIEEECLANTQAGELLDIIWEEHHKLPDYEFREVITREYEILHYAAKEGNVEFLDMILESKPDLFCERNKSGQTILHVAVLYRQQNVVSYICNKQGYKDIMTLLLDDNGNNVLHLAAKAGNTLLSQDAADDHLLIDEEMEAFAVPENKKHKEEKIMPESALRLSTAALQYEREISWFMGVEKIVPSSYHYMRNMEGKTPKQLFLKEHMELKINAEKSIRGTADSCMIVATLIATVAFSAAFTAPGGNDDKTGIPKFIKRTSFTVFTISDAVAMIFSMLSILTFLSILIWRNRDDNFHVALQRLFLGFAAMGVSICGMLFAFTSAFFLVYDWAWQPILIASFAAVPIASFLFLNTRLWIDAIGSMLLKLLRFSKQQIKKP